MSDQRIDLLDEYVDADVEYRPRGIKWPLLVVVVLLGLFWMGVIFWLSR